MIDIKDKIHIIISWAGIILLIIQINEYLMSILVYDLYMISLQKISDNFIAIVHKKRSMIYPFKNIEKKLSY